MAVKLRRATLRDLDLLVQHRRGMWEDMGRHTPAQIAAADAPFRRWARTRLRSGKLVGWIAESRGRSVGSGCVLIMDIQPGPGFTTTKIPYLLSMYTAPAHRGRGVATRIVREAMRWSKAQGYERMSLHASAQGENVYAKLGFERTREMRVRLGRRAPAKDRPRPRRN